MQPARGPTSTDLIHQPDRPVHILFVTQYFHPEVGATQTRIREFAKCCRQHGHHVTVLTEFPNHPHGVISPGYRGRWVSREVFDDFEVVRVWVWTTPHKTVATRIGFYGSFFAMATVAGLRLPRSIDVVFATSPPLSVGMIGWLIARLRGARFVLDVRDLWPEVIEALGAVRQRTGLRLIKMIERFLYRHADLITAVTRGFVRHIRSIAPDPARVKWLPNGAATELLDPARKDDTLRDRLNLDGQFVVTFAGLHGLAQGLDTVLAAAARLVHRPEIVFLFIGDGPAKPALVRNAELRGLENVRFLEMVPTADIGPYLTASDALLVPLRSHSIFRSFVPSKLYDFLACARPVLLSVDGEARDILEASGGGVFCPPGDAVQMANAILQLSQTPAAERDRMGQRGHSYVRANFTRAAEAARLLEFLSVGETSPDAGRYQV
jgi:glycosyltransferase involved in cell wall biosynthesis